MNDLELTIFIFIMLFMLAGIVGRLIQMFGGTDRE